MDSSKLPGWRIEQKFNTNVLIGNWNEERRKFQRGNVSFGNSTHRHDFKRYDNYVPDMKVRREASNRNDGLPKELIFSHHGKSYSNNCISWYDALMNKREVRESTLPTLRQWDSKSSAWVPERTDYPLQGPSTMFGLKEKLDRKWETEGQKLNEPAYQSTYGTSYHKHGTEDLVKKHHSTPRKLSSHFHAHTINKNLPLRNVSVNIAPEILPSIT